MDRFGTGGLLLDTNYVSAWREGTTEPPSATADIYVSTATLQELYNMQSGEGWAYRYLIPTSFAFGHTGLLMRYRTYARTHSKLRNQILGGNSSVGLAVHLPVELGFHDEEYVRERGHPHLVQLHRLGSVDPIRELAREALGKATAKHVIANYKFITNHRIEPLAVDAVTVDTAISLLRLMKKLGINYKKNPRNTFNDLLILATAFEYGLSLRTNDKVLKRLALENGRSSIQPKLDFSTMAPPTPEPVQHKANEINGYVNGRWRELPPRLY